MNKTKWKQMNRTFESRELDLKFKNRQQINMKSVKPIFDEYLYLPKLLMCDPSHTTYKCLICD